jgi:hypothetical protein
MPCQDDALNERSSIPPVSVTMQPVNELVAAVLEVELGGVVLEVDGLEEPHAARTSAATAVTAAALIDVLNSYLLDMGSRALPLR